MFSFTSFVTAAHFHLPLEAASISHFVTAATKFSCCSSNKNNRAIYTRKNKTRLRTCLHGVGDPGLVGLVLLFSRSGGHKTKETHPTRPGSPTPCKQGLT